MAGSKYPVMEARNDLVIRSQRNFSLAFKSYESEISMAQTGNPYENARMESFFKTPRYEKVYLKAYQDGKDARAGINNYFRFYNTERLHQALGYLTAAEVFISTLVEAASENMIEFLASDPLRIAEPNLNLAPILS